MCLKLAGVPPKPKPNLDDARVKFAPAKADPFSEALRAEVAAYFASGKGSTRGDSRMYLRALLAFALAVCSYALLVGPWLPMVARLLPALVLGVAVAWIGICVGHDALHGTFFRKRGLNRVLGMSFDLIGANSYVWKLTHNATHHIYTNVEGVDVDLDYGAVFRHSPGTRWHPWHRAQAVYALLAYPLAGIKWHYWTDLGFLRQRRIGAYAHRGHPFSAWVGFVLGKLWAIGWSVALPIFLLRPSVLEFAIGYLLVMGTTGLTLGLTFQLAHAVEGAEFPRADARGRIADSFAAHQLRTTANFACDNPLVTFFCAGLNYQIEHHLFPSVASIQYPALRPIVRRVSARFGLPYNEAPTVMAAIKSHLRHLHRLGKKPVQVAA